MSTSAYFDALSPDTIDVDLLIVGAGPVGLFGAYYAGVRGLSTAVIDSLPEPGGQITAMYPEKPIYDVAGFPAIPGRELVSNLVEQAGRYEPLYLLEDNALSCEPVTSDSGPRTFDIRTSEGKVIHTRAVVIAGGIGTFKPRPLPAGEDYLGQGLDYFVPRLADYADQDVVIVGGGDSACDWTLALLPIARSVTLVHRRKAFRAHQATVDQVMASEATVITDAQVAEIQGEGRVQRVVLATDEGAVEMSADRVVAALGFQADLGPLRTWGIDMIGNRHVPVDTTMQTTVEGIFAAGDIVEYPGKVRLIAVGFGEIATAVNNAAVFIEPEAEVFPGHSTDQIPTPIVESVYV